MDDKKDNKMNANMNELNEETSSVKDSRAKDAAAKNTAPEDTAGRDSSERNSSGRDSSQRDTAETNSAGRDSSERNSSENTSGADPALDPRALAEQIYDLDEKVYEATGSLLGRVFTDQKKRSIDTIVKVIEESSSGHILRAEVALIGNMARTIEDDDTRRELMTQYNEIMKQVELISVTSTHRMKASKMLQDERLTSLNELNLSERFAKDRREDKDNQLVICISRTYGSGGSTIGFRLADRLHINYYDAEIFDRVLQRLEAQDDDVPDVEKLLSDENEYVNIVTSGKKTNPGLSYRKKPLSLKEKLHKLNRYHGLPARDAVFFNMSDLISAMGVSEDFVVMGRCADAILTNNGIPHISIFITAPEDLRIRRMMEINKVDFKTARAQLHEVDKAHAEYYKYFTGRKWGDAGNYDLCLNSAAFGIDGTIDFICKALADQSLTRHDEKLMK